MLAYPAVACHGDGMMGTGLQPSVSEAPLFARVRGPGLDGNGGRGQLGGRDSACASPGANGTRPAFRFVDLFAGIGGLRRGFEPLGGRCVMTSERNE